jgi:hypothetical protein
MHRSAWTVAHGVATVEVPHDPRQAEVRDPMTPQHQRLTLTASLTTDVARVTHGLRESAQLIDEVLALEHEVWESVLYVGEVEYHQTPDGPIPNHQMRVSARPSAGYAALNYTDNDDSEMTNVISYNRQPPSPDVFLVFNGETGSVFPSAAAIPIPDARDALNEWLHTWRRPTCIEWRKS